MGPSGFQTKALEYRGVAGASLFFSLLALCHVQCFYRDFSRLRWRNSPRCISCSVALYCGIFLLDQLQFSRQIFLECLWRFRNFWSFKRAGIKRESFISQLLVMRLS